MEVCTEYSAKCKYARIVEASECGTDEIWFRYIGWVLMYVNFCVRGKKNEPSTNMRKSCVCLSVGQTSCEFDFFFF